MTVSRSATQTGSLGAWSPSAIPTAVWSPMAAGVLILALGALSVTFGRPWMLASLGATALLHAYTPDDEQSRAYNVVLGHAIALLAGFMAVALMGAADARSVLTTKTALPVVRVWASAFAMILTLVGQIPARAFHAPAAATALLVTLGVYRPTSRTAIAMMSGVLIVAALGEAIRRARTRDRVWHPW